MQVKYYTMKVAEVDQGDTCNLAGKFMLHGIKHAAVVTDSSQQSLAGEKSCVFVCVRVWWKRGAFTIFFVCIGLCNLAVMLSVLIRHHLLLGTHAAHICQQSHNHGTSACENV